MNFFNPFSTLGILFFSGRVYTRVTRVYMIIIFPLQRNRLYLALLTCLDAFLLIFQQWSGVHEFVLGTSMPVG